jgi:hypothetical protein
VGATFSKVPAHYPDPGNPGHYMNVFKTTLNDGQQQPVDNFAPRANLKMFLKTVPFHRGIENFKNLEGGGVNFRCPVKILAFFKTSSSPLGIINVLSLTMCKF